MTQQERCLWLVRKLLKDMPQYRDTPIPDHPQRRWQLLRSLMNLRPPMPVTGEFCRNQDLSSADDAGKRHCGCRGTPGLPWG